MTAEERRWLEVRVRCSSAGDRSDLLADGLLAAGARGVEERAGWYISYFDEPAVPEAFVGELAGRLADHSGLSNITLEHGWQRHEDWAETWKRGLGPRRLTERLVVHPSWAPPEDTSSTDIVIIIDPGMAFGTAEHGTTRGCLRLLDGVVRSGDRLLDVGAGSGILAIAAIRLGAEHVVAVEGDRYACEAMVENVERNGVAECVTVVEGWATAEGLAARGPASGAIANIEAGLLEPLFPGFRAAVTPGGWLLLSGVLDHEWVGLSARLEGFGFEALDVDADGEWRSGLFRRLA
jgi:ribosomal protein L11 methyltransferase